MKDFIDALLTMVLAIQQMVMFSSLFRVSSTSDIKALCLLTEANRVLFLQKLKKGIII